MAQNFEEFFWVALFYLLWKSSHRFSSVFALRNQHNPHFLILKIRKWLYFTNSKTVPRLVQEERKAYRGFVGEEIKDCETKNMAA